MEPLTESDRTVNVVGGYAGWFRGDARVARWKSAVAVVLALVPTSLIYAAARAALFPDIPLVPGIVVGNVFGTVVLPWLLMPAITGLVVSITGCALSASPRRQSRAAASAGSTTTRRPVSRITKDMAAATAHSPPATNHATS